MKISLIAGEGAWQASQDLNKIIESVCNGKVQRRDLGLVKITHYQEGFTIQIYDREGIFVGASVL